VGSQRRKFPDALEIFVLAGSENQAGRGRMPLIGNRSRR